ncbi:hypothetical protein PENTCL1PPCAC_17694, partial [Pristionchus entomophagus]
RGEGRREIVHSPTSVIIFLFSNTREQSKEFMAAAQREGMMASEFVFILPWLQDGGKEDSPWIGTDGSMLHNVKDQYANAIIIDDVNGFDNTILTPFLERVKEEGLTEADVDVANIYAYIYLFDALKLYAMGARKVLNETNNPASVLDRFRVWNAMRRMVFPGIVGSSGVASGIITMDDRAERAPLYRGFFISPTQDQVMAMAHMEPTMIDPSKCDGLANRSGCYDIVVTDMMTNFWPSIDGRMPLDEPLCGFRNEKCDYTLLIVGAGPRTAQLGTFRYCQRRPIIFNRADKNMFQQMKAAVHDNINPFLGISFNEKEEMLLV